jgi:hypothetical protein
LIETSVAVHVDEHAPEIVFNDVIDNAITALKESLAAKKSEKLEEVYFCDFCNRTILIPTESLCLVDRRTGEEKNFHPDCFMSAIKRTAFGCFNVITYNNEPETL